MNMSFIFTDTQEKKDVLETLNQMKTSKLSVLPYYFYTSPNRAYSVTTPQPPSRQTYDIIFLCRLILELSYSQT